MGSVRIPLNGYGVGTDVCSGRATSAAPVYVEALARLKGTNTHDSLFKPARIDAIGMFQDGGLKHNNSVNLALWECRRIWPAVERPDLVVSLGTGTDKEIEGPAAPNVRHVLQDGFIPRLYRSFLSSLDGQGTWQELINALDPAVREDYFRLNISLPGHALPIDDTECMEELRERVYLCPRVSDDVQLTAEAMLASMFFFELSESPVRGRNFWRCTGLIKCRKPGSVIAKAVARLHHSASLFFTADYHQMIGPFNPLQDTCSVCQRYVKRVSFSIRHPSEKTTICLQADSRQRKISGFPHCMNWFMNQQEFGAVFGRDNHALPGTPHCFCSPKKAVVQSRKRRPTGCQEDVAKRRCLVELP